MAYFSDLNYLKEDGEHIVTDVADIYQAIYTLFGTKKGSRIFRPTYGANLSRYLFEPCDELTARSMMYDISLAIKEEPRVVLNTSESYVIPDPVNRQFLIQLKFDIPGFNTYERTLTLSFKQRD